MDFQNCSLFGLKTISELEELVKADLSHYLRSDKLWKSYNITFDGYHIIESPNNRIKKIQRSILSFLNELVFPDYYYSSRGKSFIDGAALHVKTANHIIKMDIFKFFLSTGREKIYTFWKNDMSTSDSVAALLTNLTTVDLRYCNLNDVMAFIEKNRLCYSHLGFGLPTSVALSFLCNTDMFKDLELFSLQKEMSLSVFVDDIVLSCNKNITRADFDSVKKIIMDHGYKINRKSKYRNGCKPIAITGLYVSKIGLTIPNFKQKEYHEMESEFFNCEGVTANRLSRGQGLKNYISTVGKANVRARNSNGENTQKTTASDDCNAD